MKNKILLLIFIFITLIGCGHSNNNAKNEKNYQKNINNDPFLNVNFKKFYQGVNDPKNYNTLKNIVSNYKDMIITTRVDFQEKRNEAKDRISKGISDTSTIINDQEDLYSQNCTNNNEKGYQFAHTQHDCQQIQKKIKKAKNKLKQLKQEQKTIYIKISNQELKKLTSIKKDFLKDINKKRESMHLKTLESF